VPDSYISALQVVIGNVVCLKIIRFRGVNRDVFESAEVAGIGALAFPAASTTLLVQLE
jgi:hypothetical protein